MRSPTSPFRLSSSLALIAALLLGSCNRGGSHEPGEDSPASPHPEGTPDRNSAGGITVREDAIRIALDGREVEVGIPVEATHPKGAEGRLEVELAKVDGSASFDRTTVAYSLEAGERMTLSARLKLPEAIRDQAALVDFNLRVRHLDAIGVHVTKSAFAALPRFEAHLAGPARLSANKSVSYRVRAHDPDSFAAIEGVPVELRLQPKDGEPRVLSGTTDEQGDAFFDVQVEDAGEFEIAASVLNAGTTAALAKTVAVESSGLRTLLTTDKPLYQPGQTVHLRALTLARGDNAPMANQSVLFEIEDAKANKIFKRAIRSDGFGIAATTFRLGSLVNLGTFKVRTLIGDSKNERSFDVARYALPKFGLDVTLDKPWYRPSESLHGRIDARYFFGKSLVGADVSVEAASLAIGRQVFQRVMGKTDAEGRMEFAVTLPASLAGLPLEQGNALVTLRIAATDAAGQAVEKDVPVVVAGNAARLTLVPEGTKLLPGIENRLYAFVTDPIGAPIAGASIQVQVGSSEAVTAESDAFGQAELSVTPGPQASQVHAEVTLPGGASFKQDLAFGAQTGAEHVLVRTDRAVYDVGDTVKVELATNDAIRNVYVDWLNEGQTVSQRTVKSEGGRAMFDVELDSALLGSNRIEAYIVDEGGNVVRAGRSLFVRSDAALTVALATDKTTYLPGEPATLTFSVKDEQGAPKVAALGVQIVDEALFSLVQATPGLLRAYFELDDAFSTPQYQIAVPHVSLPSLVFDETRGGSAATQAAAQRRATAAFCGVGSTTLMGIQAGSWTATKTKVGQQLATIFTGEKKRLTEPLRAAVERATEVLKAQGCSPQVFFCSARSENYASLLRKRVSAQLQPFDLWGKAYQPDAASNNGLVFVSAGPDEAMSTWDDQRLQISWSELGVSTIGGFGGPGGGGFAQEDGAAAGPNPAAGGAGAIGGAIGGAGGTGGGAVGGTTGGAATAEAPRVRRDFPETLYVNPALITGPDGTATLQVPMADSITQWRVSSLANSPDGKLGGATHGLTVFQEFFVDINFPAELTRGDEVSLPVAVYNYLDQPQTVSIVLESAGWFTPRGPTSATLELAPNAVSGISFPVRVDDVGLQSLRVSAQGTTRSDALERTVRVVPDGKAFPQAQSGALAADSALHSVSYPATAVPGSGALELTVYPAFLSSVVGGMDSMLREPYGCFEQTTSTTWPNVLVQRYLGDTGQLSTETQLKAEAYISAGYQRLMTFEHPGGGFSWFGTQDPAPYLSVTAFGVMEFVDMTEVHAVDSAMLARTVAWLAAQQKADGTFPGDQTEFFSFHTSVVRNTAFVAWSLATAGEGSALPRALSYLSAHYDDESQDAYTLALVANAFALAEPSSPTLAAVLAQLATMKKVEGDHVYWDSGATQTSFYSQGRDAEVTTTALVAHALLLVGGHAEEVKGALDFLAAARDKQGNFGSTQATIWTLRALLLAASKGTEGAVGTLTVAVDGTPFTSLALTEDQSDVVTSLDLSSFALTGTHEVLLSFAGTGKLSYNLVSSHHLPWSLVPPAPAGPLAVKLTYDRTSLPVNDLVGATVDVDNLTAATQNMVLVDLGIPPGFEVETADLDQLLPSRVLSKYEVTPRQLILYVSSIAPQARAHIQYRLRASMPVKAADGGAKVYPYYEPTRVSQAASVTLEATL